MSERINISQSKTGSKANIMGEVSFQNTLLPSNQSSNTKIDKEKELVNTSIKKSSVKKQKTESESQNNNSKTSSKRNKKIYKDDIESNSANRSLLIFEEKNMEERRKRNLKEKKKEKRYIVDNIDNIFSKLNNPKIKLYIQEILLYIIVFNVCLYHWIFLFISRSKIERNYCFGRLNQFDSCSTVQICSNYKNKLNLIIYNNTFSYHNNSLDSHDLFVEESKIINTYYKPFINK